MEFARLLNDCDTNFEYFIGRVRGDYLSLAGLCREGALYIAAWLWVEGRFREGETLRSAIPSLSWAHTCVLSPFSSNTKATWPVTAVTGLGGQ